MMKRLVSLGALALLVAACAPAAPARTISLRMSGETADASVTVDDQHLGALGYVAKRGVALPPGQHRVTVEKPGYFPWDRLIEAQGTEPIHLEVRLIKIPD